jgi:sugar phosphate isomerase/epimerase
VQWSGRLILAAGSMLDQPATTLIDAAAVAGFDGVDLRLSGEHGGAPLAELRQHAERAGLAIFGAEVYRISTDASNLEPLLDAAAAVGAETVLVVSDHPSRTTTMTALAALAGECAARQLRLGLEYMAWTNPSGPLDAINIANEVGCELLVDVLHHVRVGAGVDELDAIVESGRLGWVQICDAPLAAPGGSEHAALVHEARHGRMLPGHGKLPVRELIARLPADVTISVEVQSQALLKVPPIERARLLHDAAWSVLSQSPSNTG